MRNSEDCECGQCQCSLRAVGLGREALGVPRKRNISIKKKRTKEKSLLAIKRMIREVGTLCSKLRAVTEVKGILYATVELTVGAGTPANGSEVSISCPPLTSAVVQSREM